MLEVQVYARVFGDQKAKLDRHTYLGVFPDYTGMGSNIKYFDVKTKSVKIVSQVKLNKAHNSAMSCPPRLQLLFDMGHQNSINPTPLSSIIHFAPYLLLVLPSQ